MNAKEVSALTGISVRTLHHYDAIGLLCPQRNAENGYRMYAKEDLSALQQILFFKECGFSLEKIRQLLQSPHFNRLEAYRLQEKYLRHEMQRLDTMLTTLQKSISAMKGESTMTEKEQFEGLNFDRNPYEQEARERWGDEAVDSSNRHLASMSKEEKQALSDSFAALFHSLAGLRKLDPACEKVQTAMEHMYRYFNDSFGYHYTLEAFANVGQMYVLDERFTKNVDQYGEGLSAFLAEAMGIYAKRKAQGN